MAYARKARPGTPPHRRIEVGAGGELTLADITDAGTAAAADIEDFATAEQGALADSAVQPGDLPTLAAGRYTPTLTEVEGFSSLTVEGAHYMRIGNQVTVHFLVTADIDDGEDYVSFRVSLPIASNLANKGDLVGPLVGDSPIDWVIGWIEGDPINNEALCTFFAPDEVEEDASIGGSFQYEIKS